MALSDFIFDYVIQSTSTPKHVQSKRLIYFFPFRFTELDVFGSRNILLSSEQNPGSDFQNFKKFETSEIISAKKNAFIFITVFNLKIYQPCQK